MFRYILITMVLLAAWPLYSFIYDGLKWLYRKLTGQPKQNPSNAVSAQDEDEEDECIFKGRLAPARNVSSMNDSDYSSIDESHLIVGIDFLRNDL